MFFRPVKSIILTFLTVIPTCQRRIRATKKKIRTKTRTTSQIQITTLYKRLLRTLRLLPANNLATITTS
jgi:hypothetical protein